ncbi:hypothetical protein DY000_02001383 [Brassica cretica]|uniref:Uncharacterized protein n=1 Tax=Brassica cretica TaxID=69181 RepID=A0ABQ7C9Z1_BRACR|nr:hypothetical protein DY000_02001383 [Brassica cretica]
MEAETVVTAAAEVEAVEAVTALMGRTTTKETDSLSKLRSQTQTIALETLFFAAVLPGALSALIPRLVLSRVHRSAVLASSLCHESAVNPCRDSAVVLSS